MKAQVQTLDAKADGEVTLDKRRIQLKSVEAGADLIALELSHRDLLNNGGRDREPRPPRSRGRHRRRHFDRAAQGEAGMKDFKHRIDALGFKG